MADVVTEKIYKGDVGVHFSVATGIDLTGASVLEIHVRKPDGVTEVEWTGIIDEDEDGDDPLNQRIGYDSVDLDLADAGQYVAYAYVEFGSTSKHSGTAFKFKVEDEYR